MNNRNLLGKSGFKMEHLDEMRLMELSLPGIPEPRNGEAAHLASCRLCADRLAKERELTCELASFVSNKPGNDFTAQVTSSFEQKVRLRNRRQLALGMALPTVLLMLLTASAFFVKGTILASVGASLGESVAVLKAFGTIARAMPVTTVGLMAAFAVFGLGMSFFLAWIGSRKSTSKYFVDSPVPPHGEGD